MYGTWTKILAMGMLLLAIGCRTPKPNLKPTATTEELNTPPAEKRFSSSDYPKEAFADRDSIKKNDDGVITPAATKSLSTPNTGGFR